MKILSRTNTEDIKCPHCNWATNTLYWLEGEATKYCGNCFSEMLAGGHYEVVER